MDNADKALMSSMRPKGILDTSEAKRKFGGGRVLLPSDLGFMTPTVAPTVAPTPQPKERDTYYDASEYFKRLDAQRARNRRSRNRRGGGGGHGGDGGGDPFGLDELEMYEDAQAADYKKSGEAFFKSQQPENLSDFMKSETAQHVFAQNAALQDFMRLDANSQGELLPEPFNIGGKDYDVFTFEDGSDFILFDDADRNDLQPGDVLRISPPFTGDEAKK
tara:strand:+ start:6040 stop:6696 length:657 start_codon:yes stop_codon:yes gene_type:complete